MATASGPSSLTFSHVYADLFPELVIAWQGDPPPSPRLLVLNEALAAELGIDSAELRSPEGVSLLASGAPAIGAQPVAQGYAGHQFGGYSPRLGDGRALLVGEIATPNGSMFDLHLKGSGRTPFSRGGDGKAAVGPMLREYLISEAIHALAIPTTRALSVVSTGEEIRRDRLEPGAVLARVASSHIRVGTFQYAAALGGEDLTKRLADHAIARHYPHTASATNPYLAFYDAVVSAQSQLLAKWMSVGFVHGVMNTDNTTISGETIDYGPCAFIDSYDPAAVFSSIDHGGRYAFGQQPSIVGWNLARLAEALLPLLDTDQDRAVALATEILQDLPHRFSSYWRIEMRSKLGLSSQAPEDNELFDDLLALMHEQEADFTKTFRALSQLVLGDREPVYACFGDPSGFAPWAERYLARLESEARPAEQVAEEMDRVNPIYIPRNHLVDEALKAATNGNLEPFNALLELVRAPYTQVQVAQRYAEPASRVFNESFQTFCGT